MRESSSSRPRGGADGRRERPGWSQPAVVDDDAAGVVDAAVDGADAVDVDSDVLLDAPESDDDEELDELLELEEPPRLSVL